MTDRGDPVSTLHPTVRRIYKMVRKLTRASLEVLEKEANPNQSQVELIYAFMAAVTGEYARFLATHGMDGEEVVDITIKLLGKMKDDTMANREILEDAFNEGVLGKGKDQDVHSTKH